MTAISPWGRIDWLLPKIGNRAWTGLCCSSFEPRCVSLPIWAAKHTDIERLLCLKVSDPPNAYTAEIEEATEKHYKWIANQYGDRLELTELGLLDDAAKINATVNQLCSKDGTSVLLDISSLPKRIFLFIVKRLMQSDRIRDLVITYTKAKSYREGRLTDDAEPPAALPGFARVNPSKGNSTVIVGVGYMAFNLGELLEQHRARSPKFLFPFPPGSPSFRRNWRLLHDLAPASDVKMVVKRISALDAFAALDWIRSCRETAEANIDMIPLGPKPHALAMGLAFPFLGDSAEIIYSQPRIYHPQYSTGTLLDHNGEPEIFGYCLRRNHLNLVN